MRKILLGTTAVVGLALAAPAAFAQSSLVGQGPAGGAGSQPVTTSGLSVRLGGFLDMFYGSVSDDADKAIYRGANTSARQGSDLRNEAEINLYVDGTAANGLRYGIVFELQMDNQTNTGVDYDELYGFVKGAWGEVRFGQEDHAASLINVSAPGVMGQGASGQWDEFLVTNTAPVAGSYYNSMGGSAPYLMTSPFDGGDATKLVYLTPQFNGFDVAVSWAVNGGEGERTDTQRDRTGLENQMSAALRYRGTLGPVGIQASFSGSRADAPSQTSTGTALTALRDFSAYSGGLTLSAMGFAVGGEYTWGNYAGNVTGAQREGLDQSKHWLVGATYTIDAFQIGVQYGVADQDNGVDTSGNKLDDRQQKYWSIGAQYVVAPGMTLFGNWAQISDKNVPSATPGATAATASMTSSSNTVNWGGGDRIRNIDVLMLGARIAF